VETKPAIYTFSGAAYQGLDISTCSKEAVKYMQTNLRIIDPLYGILCPLDTIQPYRLEMVTKNVLSKKEMGEAKNLASWWKEKVCISLSNDLTQNNGSVLLNLASDEYSAAVDASLLPPNVHCVKIVFLQEGRVISVHAKRARGLMVRYLSENGISNLDGVKGFHLEGYAWVESKSGDDILVFDRRKDWNAKKSKDNKKGSERAKTNKEQSEKKRQRKTL